jgi:hypothetical protein
MPQLLFLFTLIAWVVLIYFYSKSQQTTIQEPILKKDGRFKSGYKTVGYNEKKVPIEVIEAYRKKTKISLYVAVGLSAFLILYNLVVKYFK